MESIKRASELWVVLCSHIESDILHPQCGGIRNEVFEKSSGLGEVMRIGLS
jgi:hypothetical protein